MRHKKNKFLEILRVFWTRILDLPFGRRLVFFSAISSLVLLFFPWFYDAGISFSGFGKTFLFAGILFVLSVFALLLVLREIFSHIGKLGSFTHSDILIGVFSQALVVVILANASLSTLLLEKPEYAMSNLTLMFLFVSLGIGLAGAFFSRGFVTVSEVTTEVFVGDDVDLSHSKMTPESDLSLGDYEKKNNENLA